MAIAPNDKLLATGSQDRTAKLWALPQCQLLGIFSGHRRGLWCVQFSPMDQVLATASADGTVKLWALQDFSCLKVGGLAPSPAHPTARRCLTFSAPRPADIRGARRFGAEGGLREPWHPAAVQVSGLGIQVGVSCRLGPGSEPLPIPNPAAPTVS